MRRLLLAGRSDAEKTRYSEGDAIESTNIWLNSRDERETISFPARTVPVRGPFRHAMLLSPCLRPWRTKKPFSRPSPFSFSPPPPPTHRTPQQGLCPSP